MIIKERSIISWLLKPEAEYVPKNLVLSNVSNPLNISILNNDFNKLNEIRVRRPNWGLPELIMPSFEKVMKKSAPLFEKIAPELFQEFNQQQECGILLCGKDITIVWGFWEGRLYLWYFYERDGKSIFKFHSVYDLIDGRARLGIVSSIIEDNILFEGSLEQRESSVASVSQFIMDYLATKKHGKVETVVIPKGKFTAVEGTPLEYVDKKKVINQTGQEVIVMDSKWFRKIVNDNDIFVRGYFRMQNKKDDEGKWYKDLIFVDSHVRHGLHRDAKIE